MSAKLQLELIDLQANDVMKEKQRRKTCWILSLLTFGVFKVEEICLWYGINVWNNLCLWANIFKSEVCEVNKDGVITLGTITIICNGMITIMITLTLIYWWLWLRLWLHCHDYDNDYITYLSRLHLITLSNILIVGQCITGIFCPLNKKLSAGQSIRPDPSL